MTVVGFHGEHSPGNTVRNFVDDGTLTRLALGENTMEVPNQGKREWKMGVQSGRKYGPGDRAASWSMAAESG